MVVIEDNSRQLFIPKVDRCKTDQCNIYQLVLQKKSTKEIIVFKLRDYSSGNPICYVFDFSIPECMTWGEYDLYLLRNSDWNSDEVDYDSPKDTYRQTNKGAITIKGLYIISGDRMLVTSRFKALVKDCAGSLDAIGMSFIVNSTSEDMRAEGELFEEIEIIHTDLLKYLPDELQKEPAYVEPSGTSSRKTYKEYSRHGNQ